MTLPARQSNVVQMRSAARADAVPVDTREVEMITIYAMTMEPKAAKIAVQMLKADDFYLLEYVFLALVPLATSGTLDAVTARATLREQVTDGLRWHEEIEEASTRARSFSPANIESYCRIILAESARRQAKDVAVKAMQLLASPEGGTPYQVAEMLRTQGERIARSGAEPKRCATVAELDAQFEAEISGERSTLGMPWPLFAESQCMTPGSRITLCGGSGEGKSWMATEWLWRNFFNGVPSSYLGLEKDALFASRRNLAQLVGSNQDYEIAKHATHITNTDWAKKEPELNRMLRDIYRSSLDEMEAARVFQVPGDGEEPTIRWVLDWIQAEFERGVRFLVIDPVTFLTIRDRWSDEKNFIGAAEKLVSKFQGVILFVTHPKTIKEGVMMRPGKDNMAGVKEWHTKVDSVFWVTRHKPVEDMFPSSFGPVKKSYNSQVIFLKTKLSGDGIQRKRIALNFCSWTVQYAEIGVIPESE